MTKARDLARLSPNSSGQLPLASGVSGTLPDANAPSGSVIQVVSSVTTSGSVSTTSSTFVDTGFSLSITPSSASNKVAVFISFNLQGLTSAQVQAFTTIFRNSTNILNTTGNLMYNNNATNVHSPIFLSLVDSPNTTSSTTYSLRHRAATTTTSQIDAAQGAVTITLMEIAA